MQTFKIVLVGDSAAGKSTLLSTFNMQRDTAEGESKVTIGGAFELMRRITLDDARVCMLQLWDTAGQEVYASVASATIRYSAAALLVVDLSKPLNSKRIEFWIEEIRTHAPDALIYLIGNKTDKTRSVSDSDIKRVSIQHKCNAHMTISALSYSNVWNLFHAVTLDLFKNKARTVEDRRSSIITIKRPDTERRDKCC